MQIRIDTANLELTNAGILSCTLYLEVGGSFFPEKGWIDLASKLIPAWTDQIAGLVDSGNGLAECHFMEGPFAFHLSPTNAEELTLKLVTRQLRGDEISTHQVWSRDVVANLLIAATLLVRVAEERGLATRDYNTLRDTVKKLQDLKAKQTCH